MATAWTPEQDLLESGELDPAFVVEVETDGTATLRFGDDINGMTPEERHGVHADLPHRQRQRRQCRADSLIYFASSAVGIQSCTNPLPARGGTDPETSDQIRRRAPQAFLTQERAVTMADYDAMTELNPQVDRAAASLRWTGSWYTVFVAVEPNGGGNLTPTLAKTLKQNLERYRLAGQDLALDSPQYVPLEIVLTVCVDPYYFNSHVREALEQILSSRVLPNGQKGVFYPDNFTLRTNRLSEPDLCGRAFDRGRGVGHRHDVPTAGRQHQSVPERRRDPAGAAAGGQARQRSELSEPRSADIEHGRRKVRRRRFGATNRKVE